MSKRTVVHVLKANGAKEAPFADFTLCGIDLRPEATLQPDQTTPAMWPDESVTYAIDITGHRQPFYGKWCDACRAVERQMQRRKGESFTEWQIRLGNAPARG